MSRRPQRGLWPRVHDLDNLWQAWRMARRGKRHRPEVARFALELEGELQRLSRELAEGTWQPGGYRQFAIYERKARIISAAPFRDRVVHLAVMRIIGPVLERSFIADSYACRVGFGVHRAVARYQHFAARERYVLKLDVARYFPSIDHRLLNAQLQRRLADTPLLALLARIIDSSPLDPHPRPVFPGDDLLTPLERRAGIPIGNLTSQFFANLYLDDFDHWVTALPEVRGYLRYVDDLFLFGRDKTALWSALAAIEERLAGLRLRLHADRRLLAPTRIKRDVLGYQVTATHRWLRNDNGYRYRRRLGRLADAYAAGRLGLADVQASVRSWLGHARQAETRGLREAMLAGVSFQRAH